MNHPSIPNKATRLLSRELTMHFRVPSYEPSKHPEWPGEEREEFFESPRLVRRLRYLLSRKRGKATAIIIGLDFADETLDTMGRRSGISETVTHLRGPAVGAETIVVISYDTDRANVNCSFAELSGALRFCGFRNTTAGELEGDKRAEQHSKKTFVMARTTELCAEDEVQIPSGLAIRPCRTDADVRRKVFEVEGPAFESTDFGTRSYFESYIKEGYSIIDDNLGHAVDDKQTDDWIHLVSFSPFEPRQTRRSKATTTTTTNTNINENDPQIPSGCISVLFEAINHPAGSDTTAEPRTAMIFAVGVREQYRGKGIARTLVQRAVQCARNRGVDVLLLSADENVAPLYEKCGFRTIMREIRWLL